MRHAVVIAPLGFELPAGGSMFDAPAPVGAVCAALVRGGRGRSMLVRTTPDLPSDLDAALGSIGADDHVVVYLPAATSVRDGQPVLQAGGGRVVGLAALGESILARGPSGALFLIDARYDGDPDDPMIAADHVEAIVRSLAARERGWGALVGVRSGAIGATASWPFTEQLVAAIEDPASRDEHGVARLALVHERLRAQSALRPAAQSFALVRPRRDFAVVEPPAISHVAPRWTEEAAARGAGSAPDAEPTAPNLDDLLALADAARDRGALSHARAGYLAAMVVIRAAGGDASRRAEAAVRLRLDELRRRERATRAAPKAS